MGILLQRAEHIIKTVKVAARSLVRHKLRSALSILGVVCGVMAVLAMVSVGEGARQKMVRQIEKLGTRNIYITAVPLTQAERARVRLQWSMGLRRGDMLRIRQNCPLIQNAVSLKEVRASAHGISADVSPQILACTAGYAQLLGLEVSRGRFIADGDTAQGNLVCVLGAGIASYFGAEGQVGKLIRIGNHLFKVVGILKRVHSETEESGAAMVSRDFNRVIFLPLGAHRAVDRSAAGSRGSDTIALSEIIVRTASTDSALAAGQMVERAMEVSHNRVKDYQVIVPMELLNQARQTQRVFNIVLGAIAGVSLLVGGIGIMNIMLATVSERTREIGIRRAIGATRGDIVFQFLTEAILLTSVGGVMGVCLGLLSVWGITHWAGWDTAVTPYAVALPLFMSILVGIFFGLYPAQKAAQMDPIAALQHE